MGMEKLVNLMTAVDKNVRHDDDLVDRMHHRYTVMLIVVFTVFLGMQQYTGSPITCWAPKHFTGSHTKFTNSYCWVKNTYFLPLEEEIPQQHEGEKRREIIYYQWVPFILLIQAALFYVPHAIWRALNSKSGVDSDDILEVADKFDRADFDKREGKLKLITNQLHRFVTNPSSSGSFSFSISKMLSKVCCCICGKRFGNYLVVLYIITKALYIVNILGQLFLLNAVLKTDYNLFGQQAIENLMDDRNFVNETVFPKVTMCDFHVRMLGNVQRYTVQCLLPINLYTEKVYVFLWFWMVFVLSISCLSILVYIIRLVMSEDRLRFVRNHLKISGKQDTARERQLAKEFVNFYLRQDGCFILRMIAHNTNKITTNEIITALWENWCESRPDLMEPTLCHDPMANADTLPLKSYPDLGASKPAVRPRGNPPPIPSAPQLPSAPTLDDVDGL